MIYYGTDCGKGFICPDNTLWVSDLDIEQRKLASGIIIAKDRISGTGNFQHPRWAKIRFKADNITNVDIGDWVLIYAGHWSTSMRVIINGVEETLWYINPKSYTNGFLAKTKIKPF